MTILLLIDDARREHWKLYKHPRGFNLAWVRRSAKHAVVPMHYPANLTCYTHGVGSLCPTESAHESRSVEASLILTINACLHLQSAANFHFHETQILDKLFCLLKLK